MNYEFLKSSRRTLILLLIFAAAFGIDTVHAQGAAPPPQNMSALPAGSVFRDCADCPEMLVIPQGRFLMGAAPGEEERENLTEPFRNRSQPRHSIAVKRFAAGKFEVTRGQYRAFAEGTGRHSDGCFVWTGAEHVLDPRRDWRNPGYPQDDAHPVTCVSWEDASAYAAWLAQRTSRNYRLLSEAEWEYVARAGTTTSRFWGDEANLTCSHANGADQSTVKEVPDAIHWNAAACDDRHAYTAPVGSFRANAFGLHDLLGNAAEWTADCWNPNYAGAPVDGSVRNTGDCFQRAVRGGAWDESPVGLRAAYRVGSPVVIRVYTRGFRIARDL